MALASARRCPGRRGPSAHAPAARPSLSHPDARRRARHRAPSADRGPPPLPASGRSASTPLLAAGRRRCCAPRGRLTGRYPGRSSRTGRPKPRQPGRAGRHADQGSRSLAQTLLMSASCRLRARRAPPPSRTAWPSDTLTGTARPPPRRRAGAQWARSGLLAAQGTALAKLLWRSKE